MSTCHLFSLVFICLCVWCSTGLFALDTSVAKAKLSSTALELSRTVLDLICEDCERVLTLACTRYKTMLTRAGQKPTVGGHRVCTDLVICVATVLFMCVCGQDSEGVALFREFLVESEAMLPTIADAVLDTFTRIFTLGTRFH